MFVKRDVLPTEGIYINNVHFLPGVATEVDYEMGKALLDRKGFEKADAPGSEVKPKKSKKEDG